MAQANEVWKCPKCGHKYVSPIEIEQAVHKVTKLGKEEIHDMKKEVKK